MELIVFWQNVFWIYCRRFQTAIFMVVIAEFVVRYLVYLVAQKEKKFQLKKKSGFGVCSKSCSSYHYPGLDIILCFVVSFGI
jgi:hypothetical protein